MASRAYSRSGQYPASGWRPKDCFYPTPLHSTPFHQIHIFSPPMTSPAPSPSPVARCPLPPTPTHLVTAAQLPHSASPRGPPHTQRPFRIRNCVSVVIDRPIYASGGVYPWRSTAQLKGKAWLARRDCVGTLLCATEELRLMFWMIGGQDFILLGYGWVMRSRPGRVRLR
jgi:hypothetical protein